MNLTQEPPSRQLNYSKKSFNMLSCWAEIEDDIEPIDYSCYYEYVNKLREMGRVDEV